MRQATVLTIGLLLALPAAAQAKGGIEFQGYPDTAKTGEKIDFTVMAMKDPQGPTGGPTAIVGKHPLVTFRSKSGRIVRVRASRTDLNGIAYGSVAFPDKGPWSTEMRAGDLWIGPEMSEPIHVGIGLTQTTPAAKAPASPASDGADSPAPWIWILSLAAIGSAAAVFVVRRAA